MQNKGTVKVKPTILHPGTRCGEDFLYAGQILTVMDIAVDNEGYLVMNKDHSGLGDIHKDDVEWFKPALPDPMAWINPKFESSGARPK